jgi:hypothetical protein
MPSFEGKFFSIVFLGRQNPQILTHDFLVSNRVLPTDREPFSGLLGKRDGSPFTEFISTPVLTTIKYGPISMLVEENRYQIRDDTLQHPPASPIIEITKVYFGKLLRYTPLQIGGMNFNGVIRFGDTRDEQQFDERLGIDRRQISGLTSSEDLRVGMTVSMPWHKGSAEIQLPKPRDRSQPGAINFNYEFQYADIDSFLANLDDAGLVHERFRQILNALGVETP